jgi:indole-3-glycerol phosphate synthase
LLPSNIVTVSESGISNEADVKEIKSYSIDAVLVGEHFMQSNNLKETVNTFLEYCK